MQGKEASEQETKAKSSVGIDVSKCWLDVHVLPTAEVLRVPNTCEGIRHLKGRLGRSPQPSPRARGEGAPRQCPGNGDVILTFVPTAVTYPQSRPQGRRRVTPAERGEVVPAGGVVSPAPGRLRAKTPGRH